MFYNKTILDLLFSFRSQGKLPGIQLKFGALSGCRLNILHFYLYSLVL